MNTTPIKALKKGLPFLLKAACKEKYRFTVNNQIGIAIAFKVKHSTYTLIHRVETVKDIIAIGENITRYPNCQLLTTEEIKAKRAITFRHFSNEKAFTIKNGWR